MLVFRISTMGCDTSSLRRVLEEEAAEEDIASSTSFSSAIDWPHLERHTHFTTRELGRIAAHFGPLASPSSGAFGLDAFASAFQQFEGYTIGGMPRHLVSLLFVAAAHTDLWEAAAHGGGGDVGGSDERSAATPGGDQVLRFEAFVCCLSVLLRGSALERVAVCYSMYEAASGGGGGVTRRGMVGAIGIVVGDARAAMRREAGRDRGREAGRGSRGRDMDAGDGWEAAEEEVGEADQMYAEAYVDSVLEDFAYTRENGLTLGEFTKWAATLPFLPVQYEEYCLEVNVVPVMEPVQFCDEEP